MICVTKGLAKAVAWMGLFSFPFVFLLQCHYEETKDTKSTFSHEICSFFFAFHRAMKRMNEVIKRRRERNIKINFSPAHSDIIDSHYEYNVLYFLFIVLAKWSFFSSGKIHELFLIKWLLRCSFPRFARISGKKIKRM